MIKSAGSTVFLLWDITSDTDSPTLVDVFEGPHSAMRAGEAKMDDSVTPIQWNDMGVGFVEASDPKAPNAGKLWAVFSIEEREVQRFVTRSA